MKLLTMKLQCLSSLCKQYTLASKADNTYIRYNVHIFSLFLSTSSHPLTNPITPLCHGPPTNSLINNLPWDHGFLIVIHYNPLVMERLGTAFMSLSLSLSKTVCNEAGLNSFDSPDVDDQTG